MFNTWPCILFERSSSHSIGMDLLQSYEIIAPKYRYQEAEGNSFKH